MYRLFVCKTLLSEIFCFMKCPTGGSRRHYGTNKKSAAAANVLTGSFTFSKNFWCFLCLPLVVRRQWEVTSMWWVFYLKLRLWVWCFMPPLAMSNSHWSEENTATGTSACAIRGSCMGVWSVWAGNPHLWILFLQDVIREREEGKASQITKYWCFYCARM